MMTSIFKLNRYNWFGQKLLVQHQYRAIVDLHQHLTTKEDVEGGGTTISEHLGYLNALALMKISTRLDEIIYTLQKLNFDKNSQHFLLLCQCLLYAGNYDSVVALCRQLINREINSIHNQHNFQEAPTVELEQELNEREKQATSELLDFKNKKETSNQDGFSHLHHQESFEFEKVFTCISSNNLINEPRLWLIFGQCLEYQHQFKDARVAYRVASNLTSGGGQTFGKTSMSYVAHKKYAESCIKFQNDFRSSNQILARACQIYPQNYSLNPLLALTISAQPSAPKANFNKAVEILSLLEAHSASNRNPSQVYNELALKCMRKLQAPTTFLEDHALFNAREEGKRSLNYHLIKSYIMINTMVQQDSDQTELGKSGGETLAMVSNQADKLIESLRRTDPALWESASLWNNLGICYLVKRRFIACLSCFQKAHHLDPFNWRINYNLAIACARVGLISKSLVSLLAAKSLNATELRRRYKIQQIDPLITNLLAICFDRLDHVDEARRLYIETTSMSQKGNTPYILALANYLVFLHRTTSEQQSDEQQQAKLKLHLLDQLEQCWLQRDQNNPQFNRQVLDAATKVASEISDNAKNSFSSKKIYAWTKQFE